MKRTPLLPYQVECVEEIEDFNLRCLLACDMGLGKTLMALKCLHDHPEIATAVVVCPASIKWVWEREAKIHMGIRSEVLEGKTPDEGAVRFRTRLYIINYDILKNWLPFLRSLKPGLVIFDECHALQSRMSQRSRLSKQLVEGVKHVLALSGTPLVNRPIELWPVLNMLRSDIWPNFFSFAHKHGGARLIYGRWDFRGASRLKELNKDLKTYVMVRRRKEDVLDQLPAKQRSVLPLPLTNQGEYQRAVRDFLGWLKKISPSRARRAARAEKMVKVSYLLQLAARLKLPAVFEWVDNYLAGGGKLLLFGIHEKILDALEERYKKICVRVDGSVTGRKRQSAFDQFNRLPKTRLFLGNVEAAGVGWSCTATSSVAHVELPWSPGKLTQADDRAYGLYRGVEGQKMQSWILVARGTIEERLCEILQKKQKTVTKTLDGGRMLSDLNIYDQLILELEKEIR